MCTMMKAMVAVLIMYSARCKSTEASSEYAGGDWKLLKTQALNEFEDDYTQKINRLITDMNASQQIERNDASKLPPFSICYQCLGMTTSSGERFGCAESMNIDDISGVEVSGVVRLCAGDCIIVQAIDNRTTTFTRTCSNDRNCVGSIHCTVGANGVCRHCCNGHFCNRDVPPFMMKYGTNQTSNTVYTTPDFMIVAITSLAAMARIMPMT